MVLPRFVLLAAIVTTITMPLPVCSVPIESPHATSGAPLLMYLNPAFLYLQPELPIGIQANYCPGSGSMEIRSGFAKGTGKTGVAIGIDAVPDEKTYRFSFAGSQLFGPLAIASDIDLIASRKFNAAIGLSIGHAFMKKHLISLNLSDLTISDTAHLGREAAVRTVGSILLSEKFALSTDVQAGIRLVQPRKNEYGYIIGADIQKDFFKNHALTVYCGGYGEIHPVLQNVALVTAGAAVRFPVGTAAAGICAGYIYDYYKTKTAVTVSFMVNPTLGKDRAAPAVSVTMEDSILVLSGSPLQQRIALSLTCKDEESGSGIVRWILIVSRDYDGHTIERAFSGGGPAPATLIWDGRASNGTLCDPGVYFVRLSAVDRRKNLGQSVPVRIVVKN